MSEIEEAIKRLKKQANIGFIITDKNSKIVRSSLSGDVAPKVH